MHDENSVQTVKNPIYIIQQKKERTVYTNSNVQGDGIRMFMEII